MGRVARTLPPPVQVGSSVPPRSASRLFVEPLGGGKQLSSSHAPALESRGRGEVSRSAVAPGESRSVNTSRRSRARRSGGAELPEVGGSRRECPDFTTHLFLVLSLVGLPRSILCISFASPTPAQSPTHAHTDTCTHVYTHTHACGPRRSRRAHRRLRKTTMTSGNCSRAMRR